MATAIEEAIAEDPLAELVDGHLKKVQEMMTKGRSATEAICVESIRISKETSAALHARTSEDVLAIFGIEVPPTAEAATDAPSD